VFGLHFITITQMISHLSSSFTALQASPDVAEDIPDHDADYVLTLPEGWPNVGQEEQVSCTKGVCF
jgi:hypothetical protein